jgi:hypothetical protein
MVRPSRTLRRSITRGAAGILVLLGAACDGGSSAHPGAAAPHGEKAAARIDWASRTVSIGAPGWTIAFCEGEGPFLCVSRDGSHIGSVELLAWPVEGYETVASMVSAGRSEQEALEAAAADLLATLAADRTIGVDPGYEIVGDEPAVVPVAGKDGLRSGLRGILDGRTLERVVQYRVIDADTLYLLSATGMFVPDDGVTPLGEFRLGDLEVFVPLLDRVAAGSRFRATRP